MKNSSIWTKEETARKFLENERVAVPGEKLQKEIISKIVSTWPSNPSRIADLGCGDGVLGRSLLEQFPSATAVFIDISDTMLEATLQNLAGIPDTLVMKADLSKPSWKNTIETRTPFDIVISGFAIHHFTDDRKKELYSEIYELLSQGGVFLNLEHVSSSTPKISKLFSEFYTDHLCKYHLKSDPSVSRANVEKFYNDRADKDEDKLVSVETQCGWLKDIGFTDVDCYYKMFEIAIFGGRKAS